MTTAIAEVEVTETALAPIPAISTGALESITRGEIAQQVTTARMYPRSVARFRQECLSMATLDQRTAQSMFYAVPRGGKTIEGPSVRLAEIAACCWGNLRHGSRIVDIAERHVVAQGFCFDLERNAGTQIEVNRRITDKTGKRYGDDMITVTCAAACSIALRQAIFKVIPRVFVDQIWLDARKVAIGDAKTFKNRLADCAEHFAKMGVSKEQIARACQKATYDDLTMTDLAVLIGLTTAITSGETTVDEAFGEPEPRTTTKRAAKSSPLNDPPPAAEEKPAATASEAEPREVLFSNWLKSQGGSLDAYKKMPLSKQETTRNSFCDFAGSVLGRAVKWKEGLPAEDCAKCQNALDAEAVKS